MRFRVKYLIVAGAEADLIDDHELPRQLEQVDEAPDLLIVPLHRERDRDGAGVDARHALIFCSVRAKE